MGRGGEGRGGEGREGEDVGNRCRWHPTIPSAAIAMSTDTMSALEVKRQHEEVQRQPEMVA